MNNQSNQSIQDLEAYADNGSGDEPKGTLGL